MDNKTEDIARAINTLTATGCRCAAVKGETVYTADERGIAPLLNWLEKGVDLRGFAVADRIVGKAAALLFVLCGVKTVYGEVMSEKAPPVLQEHGIAFSCGKSVPMIINREGTGSCPMEATAASIDDPHEAFEALKKTAAELARRK